MTIDALWLMERWLYSRARDIKDRHFIIPLLSASCPVVYTAFWCGRGTHVIFCMAAHCIIISISSSTASRSSSNWITASCYSSIVEPANILKEIGAVAESSAAGFKHRRPPARPFYWRQMPIHTSPSGARTAAGPAQPGDEGQGEAGVGGRKNGSTWKPVGVQQRETMTETWFARRRRRRRIISPRQYCLSFSFYSPVAAHVRPSFL